MKWEGNRESDNVEDRRSSPGGGQPVRGGRSIGIGTIVIALLAGWVLGINPLTVLGFLCGGAQPTAHVQQQTPAQRPPADDRLAKFVSTVLADTEDVWTGVFRQGGSNYQQPKLVLFRGSTATACGAGEAAMGPFYCPADQKVYIDLGFYETLKRDLGAPGEFAQAYVSAHEVGHHIQKLEGSSDKMDAMRRKVSEKQYNQLSVRLELQADCYAGVWAHHANVDRQILEAGDIENPLQAGSQIGEDTLQKQAQGYAVPDSFTHGSSAQRVRWFRTGFDTGDTQQCNTFARGAAV